MPLDERAKLAASIAAGAENPDRKFMHKECITLQNCPVNLFPGGSLSGFCLLLWLACEPFQASDNSVACESGPADNQDGVITADCADDVRPRFAVQR